MRYPFEHESVGAEAPGRMHVGTGNGSDGRSVKGLIIAQIHQVHDLAGIVHRASDHRHNKSNSNYKIIDKNSTVSFHEFDLYS